MIWILALHITMMLCWCASLLYLLSLIAGASAPPDQQLASKDLQGLSLHHRHDDSLARFIFNLVATPAALAAIASGTAVFLVNQTVDPWLVLKMTLVTLLVAGHASAGALVLKLEAGARVRTQAFALICGVCVVMLLIVWIVLAKPDTGADLWGS